MARIAASVWSFWDPGWEFKSSYVSSQPPIRRLRRGFQVRAYALDLVVRPDLTWYENVEEFGELIARGFIRGQPSQVADYHTLQQSWSAGVRTGFLFTVGQ